MKLIYKGKFTSYDDLPQAQLPENAVKFDDVDTIEEMVQKSTRYASPIGLLVGIVLAINWVILENFSLSFYFLGGLIFGGMLSLPFLIVHELLHAICFPRGAEVYFYQAINKGVLFVTSIMPLSKNRFIVMSLLPLMLLGIVPLLSSFFIAGDFLNGIVFCFSFLMLLGGIGDLFNVQNVLNKVPKGAMIQLSGLYGYWFYKD